MGSDLDYADWMSELPETLWDMSLSDLAIPGSHDAMTYCLDAQSAVTVSEPLILRLLDRLVPCITRPCLLKWGTTQEQRVAEQLDAGIRYFDLRVAHKQLDSTYTSYFAHGIYTVLTVKEALQDIAHWLKSHRKEVVILAFSAFDGLNGEHHQKLIGLIVNMFGDILCPRTETPTLRTMWKEGFQVILSYDNEAAFSHEELWLAVPYWWANEVDPKKVISYLETKKESGRPEGFFVAGLNLTEDTRYILTHPCQSLNSLTMRNYSVFLEWVLQQIPGAHKTCVNIICGDFVGMSSFVPCVIGLNKKLLKEPE